MSLKKMSLYTLVMQLNHYSFCAGVYCRSKTKTETRRFERFTLLRELARKEAAKRVIESENANFNKGGKRGRA